jgi:hypothetical protein
MTMVNHSKRSRSDYEAQPVVDWRITDEPRKLNVKWTFDIGLGVAGVGAALASAAFAFVMLEADIKTPIFGGAEYLLLFTRPIQSADTRQIVTRASNRDIDMTPTASIGAGGRVPAEPTLGEGEGFEPRTLLKDYKLQTVRGGVAIIQGPLGQFSVESGSLLPNGDRIISIDRRGGKWVVVTTSGIIDNQ